VVRLLPPYIITEEEIDEGIALLDAAFVAAFGGQQR
jgi:4-aminobutyrate aminotransferase-like enzyme